MNSIDKAQPEENYKDLKDSEAGRQIKKMAEDAKTCFFCTNNATGDSIGVRPMSIQKADDDGTLWFLSAKDSHKNQEIATGNEVKLYFQGSPHADFLY
jgi:general stress protein 26